MMMKRTIITLGMACLVVFSVAACGAAPAEAPNDTGVSVVTQANTAVPSNAVATPQLTTLVAANPTAVASGITPEDAVIAANIDAADVEAGERLFTRALIPTCISCHTEDTSVRRTAPSLLNFSEIAGTRVRGESAYTYAYNSIRYANEHVVEGFSSGVMPVYDGILTDQEVYELIAYIWTLEGD